MTARVRWASFDTAALQARVRWSEFDTQMPKRARLHWAEFNVLAPAGKARVRWAEFDVRSPIASPIPPYVPGGGVGRYHSDSLQKYDIPVDPGADEDEIILAILMEIATHVV